MLLLKRSGRTRVVIAFAAASLLSAIAANAQLKPRKLGELELTLRGLTAAAEPQRVTVPKNTASGIRVTFRGGSNDLTAFEAERILGGSFLIEGDLAGPGLAQTITIPQRFPGDPPLADPFLLTIPPLAKAGNYTLSNLRVTVNGANTLDVSPRQIPIEVIDQVLITSVTTKPLTLEEIKQKGIVLDNDSYLGFEFTLGISLDSKTTEFTFPVVFDKRGVAVPQPLMPPDLDRTQMPPMTTVIPMLLKVAEDVAAPMVRMPNGTDEEVRIPSVLVIPGNVGYLKQFFAAKLFVANGAPGASNLVVHDVFGTIRMPAGADLLPGTSDDPLILPNTDRGPQSPTLSVRTPGIDGEPGTGDDIGTLRPSEQGQAEFLIRGEREGFHTIDFDISAKLEGLVTGPVTVTGKGSGGVLVRNPYFDMTFSTPAVVRQGERFTLFVTVNNISQSLANDVRVTLDASRMSGVHAVSDPTQTIDTLKARDSRTLEFEFQSDRTGQLIATYLNFDTQNGTTGNLKFTLGVGERGVALSPDTLVLPASIQFVPHTVLVAAMRVLGQGWSIANAPSGTLPRNVTRTSRQVVTEKALSLAEAGLRVSLGQPAPDAVRDLLFDFHGGTFDAGFDQILRTTDAGVELARAIGAALQQTSELAGGAASYEQQVAQIAASGSDFVTFAVGNAGGAPVTIAVTDAQGRRSASDATVATFVTNEVTSAVIVPFGTTPTASRLGLIATPNANPYTIEIAGTGSGNINFSATLPNRNGSFHRATASGLPVAPGSRHRVVLNSQNSSSVTLETDANGDGTFESQQPLSIEPIYAQGPRLISANVIGPETLSGAAPFGFQTAFLFDRAVEAASASTLSNYSMPKNRIVSARRQLSGRLVFASLEQPEGPYVPTQLSITGVRDARQITGPAATVSLGSRLAEIGAVVSGRVLDATGAPVRDALITYAQNPEVLCTPPLDEYVGLAAVRTGDDGRFELRYVRQDACGMPFQIVSRDATTGAVRSLSTSVRSAGEQIILDIALFGKGSVAGRVRDLSARVVGNAQVLVISLTDPQVNASTMTDSDGRYQIDGITVGPISVRAVKGTSLGRTSGRIDRAGTTANVDLTLDGGTVRASGVVRRVQGSNITVIPALQVVYSVRGNGEAPFIPIAITETSTTGAYSFESLPTGEYRIDAALNTRDRGTAAGVAGAGDVINQDIAIVIGGDGYGTVRGFARFPDGAAAPGVQVSLDGRGVLSNADGSFELTGVIVRPTTSQRVVAQSRDGLRRGETLVLVSQLNQVVNNLIVTLSGLGSAEFTVLDPARNPVADQLVGILGDCDSPCGCAAKKTNASGVVRFDGLPLGQVRARAHRTSVNFLDQADASVSIVSDGSTVFGVLQFSGSGTVIGTVLDPSGSPVLGADVRLGAKVFNEDGCNLQDGIAQRVRTDNAGKFRFNGVNVGSVSVTAAHPFFTTSVGARGTLVRSGDTVDFTLRLVNTISGELSGTVYLPDGVTPAGEGVEVTANGPLPDVTVTTDAQGHYRFAKIFPAGNYNLTARDAVSGGLQREQIYLRAGQDVTHDLRLKGRGTVRVNVVNGAGQPVPAAFVKLQETTFPNRTYEAALQPSSNGVVVFENVYEGPLTAQASDAFARGGRTSSVLTGPGATLDVQVALTTTGTVKGKFLRSDGTTPIPFGTVRLIINGTTIGQTTTAGTDDIGSFTFSYVPAGPVRLEAQDPLTARTGFAVGAISTESEILTLDVKAQGLGKVEGLVTSNGIAQPAAHVVLGSANYQATTFADAAGRYIIDGVPEGRVIVTASLSGNFLTGTSSGVLSGEAQTLTLDVALRDSGRIQGQVVSAGGTAAAPLSLVTVEVGGTGGATLSTTTDTAGAFIFDRVPAGLAKISANVLGGIDKATTTADIIGSATTTVTLTLNGLGSIDGDALDSAGNPIAGDITVNGTGMFPYSFTVQSGPDGNFALPSVLAGPFSANLRAKAGEFFLYGIANGVVEAGQTAPVTVQVQPSGTVTGLVFRSNGTTPAVGSNVTLQLDPNRGSVVVQVGSDGRFTARGVPTGPFTVRITDPITTGLALVRGVIANNGDTVDLGSITLDDQPISVVSVSPADGTIGVAQNAPVVITFSNALQSAAGISIRNGTQTIGATASLSTDARTVTLTGTWPDAKEITVSVSTAVTDIFGRHPVATTTTTFRTVDLSPPHVTAVVPADGAIQVESNATIVVTFDEPLAASSNFASMISVSGSSAISGTTALASPSSITFTPAAPLADNTRYTVTVNGAIDASGNTQTISAISHFSTTDTVAPVLTIASPAEGAWIRNARPQVQVNAIDTVSGIAVGTATLSLDGQSVTPSVSGATIFFTPAADLTDGTHTIDASIADRATNRGSVSGSFRIDTIAPTVPVISGIIADATLRGTIPLSATAEDATSGVTRIELLSDNSVFLTLLPASFAASYDTNMLSEGPHQFSARAVDTAGNVSALAATIRAVVDNRLLTVTFSSPAPNTPVRDVVTASASASEPVSRIEFTAAGQTVSDDTSPYDATFTLTAAGEGPLVITATAFALSGETAQATRTVAIDRTAPAAPDPSRITAEPPQNGSSLVFAYAGAVEPNANIEITNATHEATATAKAASDGTFSVYIAGEVDDSLSIVAVDAVGNRSAATSINIRRTPSLPPSQGSTSLHYDGLLVDRVGQGLNALAADGANDAVFTLSLSIGDGLTRTISYIDISKNGGIRSTRRPTGTTLGVAQDAGGVFLNRPDGEINFPVTSGTTLTLFAADFGFIVDGTTYTVTAIFTDGSRFSDSFYVVPAKDRTLVVHSADMTAQPATVVVNGTTPGSATIVLTNLRDIEGTLVPDGARVAISAADLASKDPLGGVIRSAGGTIVDGEAAANNPNFKIFTVVGGSVRATYSSTPVTPAAMLGANSVIQVQAADASGNVLGTDAVSTIDVNLRMASDRAIVYSAPNALFLDRGDRRSHFRIEIKDASGNSAADGTKVVVTAANQATFHGCCFIGSAGGQVLGGAASPQSTFWRVYTVSGGAVEGDYSANGLNANVGEVKTAVLQVNPADATTNLRVSQQVIGTGTITLVGAGKSEVSVSSESMPYVFPLPQPIQVRVNHVHDARARLIPDGSNVLVSAQASATHVGCCFISSFGGTIVDGTPSSSGGGFKFFPLFDNEIRATYSIQGVTQVSTGQTQIARIQVATGDPNGVRIDQRNLGVAEVKILGPLNAHGSVSPSRIFGDGSLNTTQVRFSHILDVDGNPLPEGSKVVVSAQSGATFLGCCFIDSIGGQILNGEPSPTPGFKTFTITAGVVDVTYGNQGITSTPGQVKIARVVLAQSGANGERLSQQALGIVPVDIIGTTSAQASANPTAFYSDGIDYRSTITVTNIKDSQGTPVPDGTLIGVSAVSGATFIGCCFISSAGGQIIGDRVATNNANFKIFPVLNGQVVLEYSSQGVVVSEGEKIATIQIASASQAGAILSTQALGTVSVRLLAPASATVFTDPINVTATAPNMTSQITVRDIKSSDGIPLPNGSKVGLSAVSGATFVGCCFIPSVGGTLSPAGTTAGDGTQAPNNVNFQSYTIAGGEVRAVYNGAGIIAGVGEVKIATVQVASADRNGAILTTRALGTATVRINGVTSTSASGPATVKFTNGLASVTFANIKDAAGNLVPDGTSVAASVVSNATFSGCCFNTSAGGTILNGSPSPNGNFKWFTTTNGSITVDYSSQGATGSPGGTVRVQLVPARPDGSPINTQTINGGMWPMTLN